MDKITAAVWNNILDGDNTLRLNYELDQDSIVFDVGGYKGEFSEKIINKFNCNVYIFEPVKKFYDELVNKFINNVKVKIFNVALSSDNGSSTMYVNDDDSTLCAELINENILSEKEEIKTIKLSDFILENKIENIDLLKLNVEGSEYEILEDIFTSGIYNKINNIQVQFHRMTPYQKDVYQRNYLNLLLRYKCTFSFFNVWQNWELQHIVSRKQNDNQHHITSKLIDLYSSYMNSQEILELTKIDLYNKTQDYDLLKAWINTIKENYNAILNKFEAEK